MPNIEIRNDLSVGPQNIEAVKRVKQVPQYNTQRDSDQDEEIRDQDESNRTLEKHSLIDLFV